MFKEILLEGKDPFSYKGGKDKTEIMKYIKMFDFYDHMIDDGARHKKIKAKNLAVKEKLKGLGVTEISNSDRTVKI